ncbi:MAG: SRPBCC family protein [Vulcanimicrobiaceae bacterium]
MEKTDNAAAPIVHIERVLDAPRELVFDAWMKPEHLEHWWGPQGFTAPGCSVDPRPGGVMRLCMVWPDGRENWTSGIFQEIVRPECFVATMHFSDRDGNMVDPAQYGMADFPKEMLIRVTFEDVGGKTKLTIEQTYSATLAERYGAFDGWRTSLDKLAALVQRVATT